MATKTAKTARTAKKRSYNSTRRQQQAAQTRADVLAAATELFAEQGWAATTLAAIADAAGVSVETIYNGFGSKRGLLQEAMNVAVVGDDEPVPLVDRAEFAALGEGTFDERIGRGIALLAEIHERSARVWEAVAEAAKGDAEIDEWRRTMEAGRLVDTRRSLEAVLGRSADERLVTLLWALFSAEVYLRLTGDGGLSRAEYESLVVEASKRLAAPLPEGR